MFITLETPPAIEDRVPEFVCEEPIVKHPLPLILPATTNFSVGELLPIPTFPQMMVSFPE